ncbi:hypothetical protein AVEN_140765-1 [Araneus ventricosus]|uniref:MADF domain-containing protein n=1 Tax=Araneus ventricosus TaxID=182803 RepID=A0A4Y2F3P7_ARAVE|nr:hypothetical protein AVEN_140765-1 [Araneus ventricosus]
MEWNNELIMEFLDPYDLEPMIWNPQNEHHKDRNHVYDAWKRIQSSLSIDFSLKVLKKKKENLMATYRKLAMTVRNSTTELECTKYTSQNGLHTKKWPHFCILYIHQGELKLLR